MRNLKVFVRTVLEKFNLLSYTSPQFHELTQLVEVPQGKFDKLLVPLPIHTHSQRIQKVEFAPLPTGFIKNDSYELAIFSSKEVNPGDVVEMTTKVYIKPVIYKGRDDFMLEDYKGSFVVSNKHADSEDVEIVRLANKISEGEKKLIPLMKKMYDYVVSTLRYGDPIDGLYSYKDALSRDKVDCGGFCMLLSSLLGVFHVPHYLAVGYLIGWGSEKKLSQHVWLEVVMPDGTIFPLDPSQDQRRATGHSSRWGGFGYTGSDRLVVSYGNDIALKIEDKEKTEALLQHPLSI
jgi:transglutaminase-like putative cysteine protease